MNETTASASAAHDAQTFVGVKSIEAWPQPEPQTLIKPTSGDPLAQRPPRDGYAVRYPDGYVSWSPKDVFEEAYISVPSENADKTVKALRALALAGGVEACISQAPRPVSGLAGKDALAGAHATAPRVSLADMEARIASEYAFTAAQALGEGVPIAPGLDTLTISILVLDNGFTIIGKSASASPDNFNGELGRRFAREDAIRQMWPLEGYLLRERLWLRDKARQTLDRSNPDTGDAGALGDWCGTDASRWAVALANICDANGAFEDAEGRSDFEDLLLGWFANAIETARQAGYNTARPLDPDTIYVGDGAPPPGPNAWRKKPVVIEAVQLTDNAFDGDHPNPEHVEGVIYDPHLRCAFINTLEGQMRADIGDWIIRGVKGELYPCKPDIFEATYEPAGKPSVDNWPQGETTPLYQISGPGLHLVQGVLADLTDTVTPVSRERIDAAFAILREALFERDGRPLDGVENQESGGTPAGVLEDVEDADPSTSRVSGFRIGEGFVREGEAASAGDDV